MAIPKSLSEKAAVAARLASWSYMDDAKERSALIKKEIAPHAKSDLISINNAECLITKLNGQLWIAFRGTQPNQLNDLKADLNMFKEKSDSAGMVHGGFKEEVDELWEEVVKELQRNGKLAKPRDVYFCGHSLGGAMATIAASRYTLAEGLFTFGSPRVGGKQFVDTCCVPHYRFVNNNDLVAKVPPAILGFKHDGFEMYFNSKENLALGYTFWQDMWDLVKGFVTAWSQFKFFDGLTDHGMDGYIYLVDQNKEEIEKCRG
tara:strand:+ start:4762 stop:5544 length:783 start_codon:yes stop_codon:yes gene_type:complete